MAQLPDPHVRPKEELDFLHEPAQRSGGGPKYVQGPRLERSRRRTALQPSSLQKIIVLIFYLNEPFSGGAHRIFKTMT
jgi:hypothetical protein